MAIYSLYFLTNPISGTIGFTSGLLKKIIWNYKMENTL